MIEVGIENTDRDFELGLVYGDDGKIYVSLSIVGLSSVSFEVPKDYSELEKRLSKELQQISGLKLCDIIILKERLNTFQEILFNKTGYINIDDL